VRAGSAAVGRLRQPVVRLLPASTTSAPRAPFVLLVLALLGGGLVLLLLLNAASAADSFRQRELQRQINAANLREQELQRKVATMQAPGALADAARTLGMVPSGEPGFLVLMPDGTFRIVGSPVPATAPPKPATPANRAQRPGTQAPSGQTADGQSAQSGTTNGGNR
jgi:hypothetical protein